MISDQESARPSLTGTVQPSNEAVFNRLASEAGGVHYAKICKGLVIVLWFNEQFVPLACTVSTYTYKGTGRMDLGQRKR